MKERPAYTEFHPRWHRTRMSTLWWLGRRPYLAFILRELSSLFVGWFILYLLLLAGAVHQGPEAYRHYLDFSESPVVFWLNVVTLFFVTYHAVTWFNLAPQAMVVHLRGKRVPGAAIAAGNYLAWGVISVLVGWLILGG